MHTPTFTVREPERNETPLLVEVPHAGLVVPPQFLPELTAPVRSLGRDADLYVDELYAEAPQRGATLLVAHVSRYVVDLNRAETDVDGQSVVGAAEGNAPRGVIWRMTTEGVRSLAAPLSREAYGARIEQIYRPYHAELAARIEAKRARFGYAVVLAAHSMPSVGQVAHPDAGKGRADVVPGSRGRTSADGRVIDAVDEHARTNGLRVVHDDPYKGGFTTLHHGRPARHVHVIQVEISRHLYMDEATLARRPARFEQMRAWCSELVAKVGGVALR